MMTFAGRVRIFVCTQPADMRRSFVGLHRYDVGRIPNDCRRASRIVADRSAANARTGCDDRQPASATRNEPATLKVLVHKRAVYACPQKHDEARLITAPTDFFFRRVARSWRSPVGRTAVATGTKPGNRTRHELITCWR